ncbi:MAG: hypothetical protein HRT71_17210 [Flavobacteriales bacterium]|nr:hypothetical protein [Flavobacteriales bacterium]
MMKKTFLLIAMFTVLLIQVNAQRDIFKEYETTVISMSNDSSYLRFSIYNSNPKMNPKKILAYAWFKSNKVFVTKGGFDGKLLHGKYTSFYKSDQMMEQGEYKKGVKNGEWMLWKPNGSIDKVINWKGGKLDGTTSVYKGDKIRTEKNYNGGKLVIEKDKSKNKKSVDWKKKEDKPAEIEKTKENFISVWMMKQKAKKRSDKVKKPKKK